MTITVFLLTLAIVAAAALLLSVNILFRKNGKFPETHIGRNKEMADRGITCASTQDREARK
ncbi:MAG: hypothetical protein LBV41_09890 [Cytophagaceae bacterium]|jgi:hypothetical protein|nr:hypothetical protein [Cytophagaceae bacterium]